jgi:hypothetical protein
MSKHNFDVPNDFRPNLAVLGTTLAVAERKKAHALFCARRNMPDAVGKHAMVTLATTSTQDLDVFRGALNSHEFRYMLL